MTRLMVIFHAYRLIAIPSLLITVSLWIFLLSHPAMHIMVYLLWTKLITTGLLLFFINIFRSTSFYFFNNLGLPNHVIYLGMLAYDLGIAILLFSIGFTI